MKQKSYSIGKCDKCGKTIFHVKVGCLRNTNTPMGFYKYFKRNLTGSITSSGSVENKITTTFSCKCGNIIKNVEKYQPIRIDVMALPLAYILKSEVWTGIKK